jgi:hypothetical protein
MLDVDTARMPNIITRIGGTFGLFSNIDIDTSQCLTNDIGKTKINKDYKLINMLLINVIKFTI